MRSRIIIGLAMLFFASSDSLAQLFLGGGVESCGAWSQERLRNSHKAAALVQWSFGFLSGRNDQSAVDFIKGVDGEGILGWLDGYCQQHPLDNLEKANDSLVLELLSRAKVKKN